MAKLADIALTSIVIIYLFSISIPANAEIGSSGNDSSTTENVFEDASQQATIEAAEKFGPEGLIIQTSEYDGIYEVTVSIKGDDVDEEVITYFEIVDGYVKAPNLGVEGHLYQYDDIVGAILYETMFHCYDCIEGQTFWKGGDCYGSLQFNSNQQIFGELQCPRPDSITFEAVKIAALGEKINNAGTQSNGGCLIATATYDSELAPQVQFLREIRDNTVLSTASGTSFMTAFNTLYYSFSPTIADWERQNPILKEGVKITIIPLISSLSLLQHVDIDSEAEMLAYGIGVILLNIGMYFVAPAIIILKLKPILRTKM